MTSSIASSSSTSGLLQSQPTTTASTTDVTQDRFMKLLVAQLNNQDPMNPMDNAQMTSQMAQINTVTGIQQLNDTVKSLGTQFSSMQVLQGASLIGHNVLINGNALSANSSGMTNGAFNLSTSADSVNLKITSPGGQLLDSMDLGAMANGQHNFQWDASHYTGGGNPTFTITASSAGQSVPTTSLVQDTITSVSSTATGMSVQLQGRAPVAYDAIQSIL
jgi:flagellar basal-body rod modification protein FlgD